MRIDDNKFNELEEELWPEMRHKKHNFKRLFKPVMIGMGVVLVFGCGMLANQLMQQPLSPSVKKIATLLDMMELYWYYSDEIENLDETLVDNALTGMTYSDIDLHTNYIPYSFADSFQSSVDATSVGIGVSYYTGDEFIVTRVYKNSPADLGGIKENDIIVAVDGNSVDAKNKELNLSDIVKGEQGSEVTITVSRNGELIDCTCVRGMFSASAYGKLVDETTGYLAITDFGLTTASDSRLYLDEMVNAGINQLIIDLRQDSGGYITTLQEMASLFIPENELVIYTMNKAGDRRDIYTTGDNYTQFEKYIILVDQNSASAAEGFTLTMKENLDNVTVLGTTTYGKGSMQDSFSLGDGSLLKLTTGKWFSPNGVNVDGVGITPDIMCNPHPIFTLAIYEFDENSGHQLDTVSQQNGAVQAMLDYLGYEIARMDGYYDASTNDALALYCLDKGVDYTNSYTKEIFDTLFDDVLYQRNFNLDKDIVYQKALEVIHE